MQVRIFYKNIFVFLVIITTEVLFSGFFRDIMIVKAAEVAFSRKEL